MTGISIFDLHSSSWSFCNFSISAWSLLLPICQFCILNFFNFLLVWILWFVEADKGSEWDKNMPKRQLFASHESTPLQKCRSKAADEVSHLDPVVSEKLMHWVRQFFFCKWAFYYEENAKGIQQSSRHSPIKLTRGAPKNLLELATKHNLSQPKRPGGKLVLHGLFYFSQNTCVMCPPDMTCMGKGVGYVSNTLIQFRHLAPLICYNIWRRRNLYLLVNQYF